MHEKYLEQLRLRYAAESALEEEKRKNQKLRAQLNRDYENSSIPSSKSLRPKFRKHRESLPMHEHACFDAPGRTGKYI